MPLNLSQEKDVIAKTKRDRRYFGLIFQSYAKAIYAYAYALTKDKSVAEDITAATFSLALDKINDFSWQEVSIKYWLFQIARNKLKAHWRDKNKLVFNHDLIDQQLGSEAGVDILNRLIDQETADRLDAYINQLPNLSAEVIRLKIWEEFDFNQIARITGKHLSTVKMAYYRGLAKLNDWLSI